MKNLATATATLALVLGLAACGESDTYPNDSDYISTEMPDIDGTEILQETWDGMEEQDRSDICGGWYLIPDELVSTVREGNEEYVTESEVRAFLEGECGV